MQIPLTPQKYAAAVSGLQAYKGGDLKSLTVTGNAVTIETTQVDLTCQYNGVDMLKVLILSKHGLARLASENTIKAHLIDMINEVTA